jgi:hypothetical protein
VHRNGAKLLNVLCSPCWMTFECIVYRWTSLSCLTPLDCLFMTVWIDPYFAGAQLMSFDLRTGCLVVELLDYRPQRGKDSGKPEKTRVVLHPTPETLWADVCLLNQKTANKWSDKDVLEVEARILVRSVAPLWAKCTDVFSLIPVGDCSPIMSRSRSPFDANSKSCTQSFYTSSPGISEA